MKIVKAQMLGLWCDGDALSLWIGMLSMSKELVFQKESPRKPAGGFQAAVYRPLCLQRHFRSKNSKLLGELRLRVCRGKWQEMKLEREKGLTA